MVSSMSVDSHVKLSPRVCHSMPRWSASLRSPTFHFSLLMNCTTATVQPRAHARFITPNAAELLPLPVPVFTRRRDGCGIADKLRLVRRLVVIGIGAGDPRHLTLEAVEAIGRVDVFFMIDKGN